MKSMVKHAGAITSATLISRIFGFIRDAMVAYMFGATTTSDAFYAAFRIANLFRRLFGEGAFSSAFIPVFSSYVSKGEHEAKNFVRTVLGGLLSIVVCLTVLGILFAPLLVSVIAKGFKDNPGQIDLTIQMTRIMFPYFVFIFLAALATGVLQVHHIFFIPALAPAALNISIIVYIAVIIPAFFSRCSMEQLAIGLSVTVVLGGIGEWLFRVPSYIRQGYSLIPKFFIKHPGLQRISRLMFPAMMGISIDQINMFISATFLASFLARGSVTALYYSDRLTQLPLALFGLSMASVALPMMSNAVARQAMDELKGVLNFSLRLVGYLVVPSAVGLIVLGTPIIQLLFQRGVFDARATQMTYAALVPFSIGMIGFSLTKILANAFYSLQDTTRPVIIGGYCMLANILLSIVLMQPFQIAGLASASAIAAFLNVFLLLYYLRKKIGTVGGWKILKTYIKIGSAALCMGASIIISRYFFRTGSALISVSVTLPAGVLIYFLASALLHIEERREIFSLLVKRSAIPTDEP